MLSVFKMQKDKFCERYSAARLQPRHAEDDLLLESGAVWFPLLRTRFAAPSARVSCPSLYKVLSLLLEVTKSAL